MNPLISILPFDAAMGLDLVKRTQTVEASRLGSGPSSRFGEACRAEMHRQVKKGRLMLRGPRLRECKKRTARTVKDIRDMSEASSFQPQVEPSNSRET